MTISGDPIDVRRLFPAERRALLDGLSPDDWRPAMSGDPELTDAATTLLAVVA